MLQLTWVLPGLHWSHPHLPLPDLDTPGLNALLHWARIEVSSGTCSQLLARHLWHGPLLSRARADCGLLPEQPAFWCTPLSQQAGMHSISLRSGTALALNAAEAAVCCAELNRLFAADGWQFTAWHPDWWLVSCPQTPNWQTLPPWDLGSQLDGHHKPSGTEAARLLQAQTEIQMLLHNLPLNRQRQQRGLLPINGVWCWQDITGQASPQHICYSDATWAGTPPLPESWPQLAGQGKAQATLVALALLPQSQQGDAMAYADWLATWDRQWAQPLYRALRSGSLKTLVLASENHTLHIHKPRLPRFWRARPVFAGTLP